MATKVVQHFDIRVEPPDIFNHFCLSNWDPEASSCGFAKIVDPARFWWFCAFLVISAQKEWFWWALIVGACWNHRFCTEITKKLAHFWWFQCKNGDFSGHPTKSLILSCHQKRHRITKKHAGSTILAKPHEEASETLPRGQSSALYLSLMETHSCDGFLAGPIFSSGKSFKIHHYTVMITGWNLFHVLFKKLFPNEIWKCIYPCNNRKLCVPLLIPRGCVSMSCWTRLTLWRFVFSRPTLQAGGQVRPRFLPPGSGWFGLSQQRSQDRHPCR